MQEMDIVGDLLKQLLLQVFLTLLQSTQLHLQLSVQPEKQQGAHINPAILETNQSILIRGVASFQGELPILGLFEVA